MEHKRPGTCYVVGTALITYIIVASIAIIVFHVDYIDSLKQFPLLRAHFMCAAFGALGASMAALRKFYQALITEDASEDGTRPTPTARWGLGYVTYYLTRPLFGGSLGALAYLLSYVGIQIMVTPEMPQLSPQGRLLMYGLAFVAGYGVGRVLDRIEAVSNKIFGKAAHD